jgi:hypothetical protein
MYINSAEIRLDPQRNSIDVAEDDWAIGSGSNFMTHMPSHVTFQIDLDEGMETAEKVSVLNYSARPVHISRGYSLPCPEQLIELGRVAIILFLHVVGALQTARLAEAPHTGEPDLNVN